MILPETVLALDVGQLLGDASRLARQLRTNTPRGDEARRLARQLRSASYHALDAARTIESSTSRRST